MFSLTKVSIIGNEYPAKIKKTVIKKSKSYIQILTTLKSRIVNSPEENTRYIIQDSKYLIYEEFNNKGICTYRSNPLTEIQPFLGNDNPKYKLGEIVEVYDYDELRLGVITGVPVTTEEVKKKSWKLDQSDDVYLVDFSKDTNEHLHPHESSLGKPRFPVPEETRKELEEAFREIVGEVKLAQF